MNFSKVIVILLATCVFMSGCGSESEEHRTNSIYPMQLQDNEDELVSLIEGSNSIALLTASLDGTFTNAKIMVESYRDGELVQEQGGLSFGIDDTFDIAIMPQDIGNWNMSVKTSGTIISGNLDLEDKFDIEEGMLQAWSFMNYETILKLNEPQIIGVYYFDDSNSIGHEASVYEKNEIENIQNYKYLYVMKIVFE
jgi:hypothetical protein